MKKFVLVILIVLLLVACSPESEKITFSISLEPDGDYLTVAQQIEFEALIDDYNAEADAQYFIWTDGYIKDDAIEATNAQFKEIGVIGIFVDVCKDGSLYVKTEFEDAIKTAEELNNMNTNSFSRAMFFVDSVAKITIGKIITVYNPNKDIFK